MPSFILPGVGEDLLSVEDVAWMDSCLVPEADFSANNWDAVKDALLGLIDSEMNLTSSSTDEMDTGAYPSSERVVTSERPARRGNDLVLAQIEDLDRNDLSSLEETSSPIISENSFQSTYDDEFLEDTFDRDEESKLGVHEVGLSPEEIFKVWDLNAPPPEEEEGGLLSQLQKALRHPYSDDSSNWKQPEEEEDLMNFNNLVSGISDLSLMDTSS